VLRHGLASHLYHDQLLEAETTISALNLLPGMSNVILTAMGSHGMRHDVFAVFDMN